MGECELGKADKVVCSLKDFLGKTFGATDNKGEAAAAGFPFIIEKSYWVLSALTLFRKAENGPKLIFIY